MHHAFLKRLAKFTVLFVLLIGSHAACGKQPVKEISYASAPNDDVIKGIKALHKKPQEEMARLSKLVDSDPVNEKMPEWLYLLALGHEKMGYDDKAYTLIEHCLELTDKQGLMGQRAKLLTAKLDYKKGNNVFAIRKLNEIYKWSEEHGVVQLSIGVLMTLGRVFQSLHEPEITLQHYTKAYRMAAEFETQISVSHIAGLIGSIYLDKGEFELAFKYLNEALMFSNKQALPVNQGRFSLLIGQAELGRNNAEEAKFHLQKAISIAEETVNFRLKSRALVEIGKANISLDSFKTAQEALTAAKELSHTYNLTDQLIDILLVSARLSILQSRFDEALEIINNFEVLFGETSEYEAQLQALELKAKVLKLTGNYEASVGVLERHIQTQALMLRNTDKTRVEVIKALYALDVKEKENNELKFITQLQSEKLALKEQKNGFMLLSSLLFFCSSVLFFAMYAKRLRCQKELESLATTDFLTGLYNRRKILNLVEQQIQSQYFAKRHMVVAMLDIDYFKLINDTFGHQMGDDALVFFAREAESSLGSETLIGRIGGEEFICCFLNKSDEAIEELLVNFKIALKEHAHKQLSPKLDLSFSAGVYRVTKNESLSEVLEKTDSALYSAKEQGRNKIVFF